MKTLIGPNFLRRRKVFKKISQKRHNWFLKVLVALHGQIKSELTPKEPLKKSSLLDFALENFKFARWVRIPEGKRVSSTYPSETAIIRNGFSFFLKFLSVI